MHIRKSLLNGHARKGDCTYRDDHGTCAVDHRKVQYRLVLAQPAIRYYCSHQRKYVHQHREEVEQYRSSLLVVAQLLCQVQHQDRWKHKEQ